MPLPQNIFICHTFSVGWAKVHIHTYFHTHTPMSSNQYFQFQANILALFIVFPFHIRNPLLQTWVPLSLINLLSLCVPLYPSWTPSSPFVGFNTWPQFFFPNGCPPYSANALIPPERPALLRGYLSSSPYSDFNTTHREVGATHSPWVWNHVPSPWVWTHGPSQLYQSSTLAQIMR